MAAQQEPASTAAGRSRMNKYFPTVAKDAVFCIGCASLGHIFEACPLRTCKLCGSSSDEHLLFGCTAVDLSELSEPTHIVAEDYTPKSRSKAKDMVSKCPICLEDVIHFVACPLLWRAFVQNPTNTTNKRSAAEISVSCYFCGQDDHYGGDCKDNTGEHLSGRRYERQDDVWNRKYVLQFSDLTKTKPFTGSVTSEKDAVPSTTVLVVRESKRQKKANAKGGDASKAPQTKAPQNKGNQQGGGGKVKPTPKTTPKPKPNPKAAANATANVAQDQGKGKRKKGKGKGKADGSQPEPPAQAKNAGDQNPTPVQANTNPPKQGKAKGKGKGKQAAGPQEPNTTRATEPAAASAAPPPARNSAYTPAVARAISAHDTPAPAPGDTGQKQPTRSTSQAQDRANKQGQSEAQTPTDGNTQGNSRGQARAPGTSRNAGRGARRKAREEATKEKAAAMPRRRNGKTEEEAARHREKYPPRNRRARQKSDGQAGQGGQGGQGNAVAA